MRIDSQPVQAMASPLLAPNRHLSDPDWRSLSSLPTPGQLQQPIASQVIVAA